MKISKEQLKTLVVEALDEQYREKSHSSKVKEVQELLSQARSDLSSINALLGAYRNEEFVYPEFASDVVHLGKLKKALESHYKNMAFELNNMKGLY